MLTELYCIIDDFGKLLEENLGEKKLLGSTKTRNVMTTTLSEIATITLFYHYSGYKDFKSYYEKHVKVYLKKDFPSAPSYSRMIELKQDIFWFLALFVQAMAAPCTGISIVDSTSLEVCHSSRRYRHKTFKGLAQSGKTSVKWFFGFKMHMIINHLGQVVSFYITPGNVADNDKNVLEKLTQNIYGKLVADRGYLGRFQDLYERGIILIHSIRSNMKNKLIPLFDKFLLRQRGIIETVFGILKADFNLEHSRHRSVKGFFINIFTALAAYAVRPEKPSINLNKALLLNKC
jgi:hypothetical protein